jgi:hypothetical protein
MPRPRLFARALAGHLARLAGAGAAGAIALLASAGCVADSGDEAFVIRNNLAAGDTSCAFTPQLTAASTSRGTLNTRSPDPYLLAPLIESRITAATGQESLRTVSLMGAKIDLAVGPITVVDGQGNTTFSCAVEGATPCFDAAASADLAAGGITRFRSLFSAPLAPNMGLTAATFDLVPTTLVREIQRKVGALAADAHLRAQVVATARVYGQLNGSEVESPPFVFPVTVCNDCVVNILPTSCAQTPKSFVARKGNPCNPYQDGVLDCCQEGTSLICPAVGTAP